MNTESDKEGVYPKRWGLWQKTVEDILLRGHTGGTCDSTDTDHYRTIPLEIIFKTVNEKLRGHYQYYEVTDNIREIASFLQWT